jgi:hypothetical protein
LYRTGILFRKRAEARLQIFNYTAVVYSIKLNVWEAIVSGEENVYSSHAKFMFKLEIWKKGHPSEVLITSKLQEKADSI